MHVPSQVRTHALPPPYTKKCVQHLNKHTITLKRTYGRAHAFTYTLMHTLTHMYAEIKQFETSPSIIRCADVEQVDVLD